MTRIGIGGVEVGEDFSLAMGLGGMVGARVDNFHGKVSGIGRKDFEDIS
jgi:hypothetical protein